MYLWLIRDTLEALLRTMRRRAASTSDQGPGTRDQPYGERAGESRQLNSTRMTDASITAPFSAEVV